MPLLRLQQLRGPGAAGGGGAGRALGRSGRSMWPTSPSRSRSSVPPLAARLLSSKYTVVPESPGLPALITSQLQDRKVAKIVLSNGVKGVVISDRNSPTTGAALSVEAGSWMDPGNANGMAHFLEHLLFLGTKKYPDPHDYERFIFDANGSLNGYTSSDHSLYYFSGVTPAAFDGALDRFSRFFYEPLFDETCVEREMNAVDQEFQKNCEQDGWRVLHVRKELADQRHPFAGFNTGNLETMKLIDRTNLRAWFKERYSANLMHFAILGRDTVSQLAEKAERAFGRIENHERSLLSTEGTTVFPNLRSKVVWIAPLKDLREMTLSWEIPIKYNDGATKPARLVSAILGYEGQNSLLSLLKQEELAEGLSAGKSHLGADNLLFEISISLTERGVKEWRTVASRVFEAMAALKTEAYPRHILEEVNLVNKLGYQYQQRNNGIATTWCGLLRKEGIDTFPRQSYFIDKFDGNAAQSLLQELRPDACLYTIIAQKPEVELTQTEKWMGAKYAVVDIKAETSAWMEAPAHKSIQYPKRNPYIPTDLMLSPRSNRVPELLKESDSGKLYFYPDGEFEVPESAFSFNIRTPAIRPDNPRALVLASLYLRFVHERLTELSYDAATAGLHYDVSLSHTTGIVVSVDGYSEKTHLLLASVLERMSTPAFTLAEFEIYKDSVTRSYRNHTKESPLRQAMSKLAEIMYDKYSNSAQLAEAAESVTLADLESFTKTLFSSRYVEAFVGGNATAEEARRAWDLVHATLPGSPCPQSAVEKAKALPFGSKRPAYHPVRLPVKGNAIVWTVALGPRTPEARTGLEFLSKLIKEPFYSELRTKQQTGYIVSSGSFQVDKNLFLNCSVQSNSHDPRDLLARIELFVEKFLRDLVSPANHTSTLPASTSSSSPSSRESSEGGHEEASPSQPSQPSAPAPQQQQDMQSRFDVVKAASLARLRQPHDTMAAKIRYFNHLAFEEDGDFGALERRIEAMEAYTLDDLRAFAKDAIGRSNARRVAVLVEGNSEENSQSSYEAISALDDLRKRGSKL
ncbi:hypothetical protein HKX48_007910 [Thoreauomyces humboldtii]|nr:hypothetical protein HKX48_007910 [Thoreauomyces humboldtii]